MKRLAVGAALMNRELLAGRLLRESAEGGPFRVEFHKPGKPGAIFDWRVRIVPASEASDRFHYRSREFDTKLEAESWLMERLSEWTDPIPAELAAGRVDIIPDTMLAAEARRRQEQTVYEKGREPKMTSEKGNNTGSFDDPVF